MAYEKKLPEENRNRIRKGFDSNGGVVCKDCFNKSLEIDKLRGKVKELSDKLRRKETPNRNKTPNESHEPSSRKRFKENSKEKNQLKKGAAKNGHVGSGRKSGNGEIELETEIPEKCPCCDVALNQKDVRKRTIVEVEKIKAKRQIIGLKRGECPKCRKTFQTPMNYFPKALYGNRLLSQASVMHYVHGIPIGRILEILGPEVTEGGLFQAFHKIGLLCHEARNSLINEFRNSYLKQADETGWRTDGSSGYAWIFVSPSCSILEFRDNRSSRIPNEIFGTEALSGVLVVDRYNAYNKLNIKIQYCYAHLLRDVEALEKEFSENKEVLKFCSIFSLLLAKAMKLQGRGLTEKKYLKKAAQIKKEMITQIETNYSHLGIRRIQEIFHTKSDRMYHWVEDPRIPAHNNASEREIRPTVIARKTSFGSQSEKGARTRSSIMTYLFTAKKRPKDSNQALEEWFYNVLNKMSREPKLKIYELLPPFPP